MREIKFRAWHLDDGMVYFDFDTFKSDYHDQYGNIMQFTGLQDKSGVDIYEGDILLYQKTSTGTVKIETSGVCVVGFECFISNLNFNRCKVIGNIHKTK